MCVHMIIYKLPSKPRVPPIVETTHLPGHSTPSIPPAAIDAQHTCEHTNARARYCGNDFNSQASQGDQFRWVCILE